MAGKRDTPLEALQLDHDPIPALLASNDPALQYFVRRDLLEEQTGPIHEIWQLPAVQKILKKQQLDGSWKSPGKNQLKYPAINYSLIETWKQFRFLIDQYEMDNTDPSVEKAGEYIFSCQTDEGDIRGILGNQYAAYYTGALMALLIKAGYENDPRIEKGFQWLLSVRQDDGGWLANALMTLNLSWKEITRLTSQDVETVPYKNTARPSSHNWTGMVIRAFAAHPVHRKSAAAWQAAELLKARFFQEDPHYSSYRAADYWVTFRYPYWWNNLVAALDSLSVMGFSKDDRDIKNALNWLASNQQENGLWKVSYARKKSETSGEKAKKEQLWISYAICRVLKQFNAVPLFSP
ncbi:MAG: prenyltransferase/squalene oxidase repeat-containing protein [Candidatus Odinarchaeota archaeon]